MHVVNDANSFLVMELVRYADELKMATGGTHSADSRKALLSALEALSSFLMPVKWKVDAEVCILEAIVCAAPTCPASHLSRRSRCRCSSQALVDPVDLAFKQKVLVELGMGKVLISAAKLTFSDQGNEALDNCHSMLYFFVKVHLQDGAVTSPADGWLLDVSDL